MTLLGITFVRINSGIYHNLLHSEPPTILIFIRQLFLNQKTSSQIVMILDNARIHHAKLIQPFLEEHKFRLHLVFLPPYSPKYNLIEGLWGWMKSEIINNVFYTSVMQICKEICKFIDSIIKTPNMVINRLCVKL